jgi:hypothetical protein
MPLEASYNGLRTIDVDKLKFRCDGYSSCSKAKVGKERFHKTEEVKYTQILLFGLKILLTLTTSQCIMTISGIKLTVIILL